MLEEAPFDLLCPGRRPSGLAPVPVAIGDSGQPDWDGFAHLLGQVVDSGLVPYLNAGPGFADLLSPRAQAEVVATAGAALRSPVFVAGVRPELGSDGSFDPGQLAEAVGAIGRHGGIVALMPSPTLAAMHIDEAVGLVAWMGEWCERIVVADLPAHRWSGGRSWGTDAIGALMEQASCIGVIDGSWDRQQEWERIRRRDEVRPDFHIFSANVLAVDQIMYGADHALDLSAAVPDAVADRDAVWAQEDPGVVERNDALQALATIVFRPPVEAARHALLRTLYLRGWLSHDGVPDGVARRPASDDELLLAALDRLGLA